MIFQLGIADDHKFETDKLVEWLFDILIIDGVFLLVSLNLIIAVI
jgi:hypothetical protein